MKNKFIERTVNGTRQYLVFTELGINWTPEAQFADQFEPQRANELLSCLFYGCDDDSLTTVDVDEVL